MALRIKSFIQNFYSRFKPASIDEKSEAKNSKNTDNTFIQNIAWLGFSEAFVRVTRLVTAVVLARFQMA